MNHPPPFRSIQTKFSLFGKLVLSAGSLCWLVWAFLPLVPFYCRQVAQDCSDSRWDLVTLLVSLGFWVIGLVALTNRQSFITIAFFSIGSAALSAGFLSGYANDLADRTFYILLAWLSPVFVHFHLTWSLEKPRRLDQIVLLTFYLLAVLASIPFFAWTYTNLNHMGWLSTLRPLVRFSLVLSVTATASLLVKQLREPQNEIKRFRIRLVFTAVILALSPLLLLSLLPDLVGLSIVPYEVNFTWLLIIPIGYGYALLRKKVVRGNAVLIRLASYYLVGVLFTSVFIIALQVLIRLIPSWSQSWAWPSTALGIVLLFLLARANSAAYRLMHWLLFGSEHSHLELLSQMNQSLGTVLNRGEFQEILVERFSTIIPGCQGSALFLKTDENDYTLQGTAGFEWPRGGSMGFKKDGVLSALLLNSVSLIEDKTVHKKLDAAILQLDEHALLSLPGISLWVPLVSGSDLHGLWLIGLDPEVDTLAEGDRQVFSILTRQAGMAAHNILLMELVQDSRDELAHAHQRLLQARDEERREIARDLHDNPLQELLGISIQIASLAKKVRLTGLKDELARDALTKTLDHLRQDILSASDQLRLLIGDLRPDGLEELGLNAALESFVRQTEYKMKPGGPLFEVNFGHGSN